ncbi:MAG: CHRD domain-containing protein, partial [Phycisphaerae bacterium]|nr:CHRD domain-containing protein [Phycisphaerae bacterium]
MITRTLIGGFAMAGVLVFAAEALASARCHMVASITAQQEVPPTAGVNGFGCGEFLIDTNANTVTYRIVYSGLTSAETAAHIHGFVAPGVNAGVVHPLPLGNVKTGVWNYAEAQEASILAGRCYVNIHTANNPGGEIRGQITTHVAELDAGQETPPVGVGSRGWAVLNLDKCQNTLSYYIVVN